MDSLPDEVIELIIKQDNAQTYQSLIQVSHLFNQLATKLKKELVYKESTIITDGDDNDFELCETKFSFGNLVFSIVLYEYGFIFISNEFINLERSILRTGRVLDDMLQTNNLEYIYLNCSCIINTSTIKNYKTCSTHNILLKHITSKEYKTLVEELKIIKEIDFILKFYRLFKFLGIEHYFTNNWDTFNSNNGTLISKLLKLKQELNNI